MKRKLKNKKLNNKKILGLTSLILAGSLVTACNTISGEKQYEYSRIEFTTDGIYKESKQYKEFYSDQANSLISYDAWEQLEDGKYSRKVEEYNVTKKTYEDIKKIFDNNLDLQEELGIPIKTYHQTSETLSSEEIERGSYIEATIYDINEDKYVMVKNDKQNIWILLTGSIVFASACGVLIAWKKYDDKLDNINSNKNLTLKK